MRIFHFTKTRSMKLKTSTLPLWLIAFLFLVIPKAFSQPGIGIPYGITIQPTALVIPAGPFFNVFVAATDELISNTYIPTAANVSACPGAATYPGFTFGGVLYSGFAMSSNGFVVLTNLPCNTPTGLTPLPANALSNTPTA